MSPQSYTVRCNPASPAKFKTTLWKGSTQVTADIVVNAETDFVLRAEQQGFKLSITPMALPPPGSTLPPVPASDIGPITGQNTQVVTFTDFCKVNSSIDLTLSVSAPGGPFPMGPKPIIRNEPRRLVITLKMLATAVLLVALAITILLVWQHRG